MTQSSKVTRRSFIEKTAAGVAAPLFVSAALGQEGKAPPSERVRLGLIGAGGMGRHNLANCAKHDDVVVTAICEVWKQRRDQAIEPYRETAKPYTDYRELLQQEDVDAVIIATPPHWHALQAIEACEAGKDIYLQKPMTLHLAESIALRNAVKKHKRIVQIGTQIHSGDNYRRAAEIVRSGNLGRVSVARTFNMCNIAPDGIGNDPDDEPPAGLDWPMWVGPGPMRPFNPLIVKSSFTHSSFLAYSGGWTPCWAPHIIDLAVWGLDVGLPTQVSSTGGRFTVDDAGDVWDCQETVLQYPETTITWMMNMGSSFGFNLQGELGTKRRLGTYFQGTNGTLYADYSSRTVVPEGDRMKPLETTTDAPGIGKQEREWLDCVRSRQQPSCNVEYHHKVNVPIVLGNLSMRLGRGIRLDPVAEKIVGDDEAARMSVPEYRDPWEFPADYL